MELLNEQHYVHDVRMLVEDWPNWWCAFAHINLAIYVSMERPKG